MKRYMLYLIVTTIFIIGCPKPVILQPLPSNTVCHIFDYCTGITCCTFTDIIGRSIQTYIQLDSCNRKMNVGIERLGFNVSLFDYQFGVKEHMKLYGHVHVE
jgi:hypothetical protein